MRTMNKGLAMAGLWMNPQFTNLEELVKRMNDLETAHLETVHRADGRIVPNKFHVVGDDTDVVYSIPTKKYTIVHHVEVLVPLAIALDKMGVSFSGSILEDAGEMYGFFQVGEPIEVGYEEFRSCVEVHNSYNCAMSFGGSTAFTRTACQNGMIDVAGLCEHVKQRHMSCVVDAVDEWEKTILANQVTPEKMQALIDDNMAKTIPWNQLEAVLRGMGMGEWVAKQIYDNFDAHCPEVTKWGLNSWTVFCAVTNYYSHRQKASIKTNRDGIMSANALLNNSPGTLYNRGLKLIASP